MFCDMKFAYIEAANNHVTFKVVCDSRVYSVHINRRMFPALAIVLSDVFLPIRLL